MWVYPCGLPWSKEAPCLSKLTIHRSTSQHIQFYVRTQRPSNNIKIENCTCDRLAQELCRNKKCGTAGQCLEAGQCNEWTGRCEYEPKTDGTRCDDFDPFTADDTCTAGFCKGQNKCENVQCPPRSCQQRFPGQAERDGQCDPTSGNCLYMFKPDKAECTFELQGETLDGTCTGNQCVSNSGSGKEDLCARVTCTARNSCESSDGCDSETGLCKYIPKADGEPCTEDTGGDDKLDKVCRNSECVVKKCLEEQPCRKAARCEKEPGRCDLQTGMCYFEHDEACDVQQLREETERCQGQLTCLSDLQFCKKDSSKCISSTKFCNNDGAPCDKEYISSDGRTEHVLEIGVCRPNQAGELKCMMKNDCEQDGRKCDSSNQAITDTDCKNFECVGKDLCDGVVCQNRTDCFLPGLCNPKTGMCEYARYENGRKCYDKTRHTFDECYNGGCGEDRPCDNFKCPETEGCTQFECDKPTGDCLPYVKPSGTFCSDNDARTFGDVCDNDGICVGQDPCKDFKCAPACLDRSNCKNGKCEECVPIQTTVAGKEVWVARCKFNCDEQRMTRKVCVSKLAEPCQVQSSLSYKSQSQTCKAEQSKPQGMTCYDQRNADTWSGFCNHKGNCELLGDVLCGPWACKDFGECYDTPKCQSKKVDAKTLVANGIFSQEEIESDIGKKFDYNGDRKFDSYELNTIFKHKFVEKVEELVNGKAVTNGPGGELFIELENNEKQVPSLEKYQFREFATKYFEFLQKPTEQLYATFVQADTSQDGKIELEEFEILMQEVVARLTLECSQPKQKGPETPCTPTRRIPNVQGYFCRQGECVPEITSDTERAPLRFLRISNRAEYYKWLDTVVFAFYANATENNWMLPDGNAQLLFDLTVRWVSTRVSCLALR